MKISCSLFNRMVSFNISDELAKGNIAVGLMVMGLFIGIGIALGMVIGLGLPQDTKAANCLVTFKSVGTAHSQLWPPGW